MKIPPWQSLWQNHRIEQRANVLLKMLTFHGVGE